MKTAQIYYEDPYKVALKAKVLSVAEAGNLFNVILDQTIFYPEGGGQPSDRGTIGNTKIEYVRMVEGEIIHQVKGALKEGDEVECSLDWDWRLKHMKIHTAGHILHDVLMTLTNGLTPIKGSHGKKAFIEYSGTFDPQRQKELEDKVNETINQDLPVITKESNYEELEKECKFLPPHLPKNKPLRMIKIGDFPPMPDGGVHVKSTKEIGQIWIISIQNENGNTTIRYGVKGSEEK